MKCYNCGGMGHSAKNCPKGTICHKCKKPGHMSKDCPSFKNSNNINNNNININSNNNNSLNNEIGAIKCYNCGKLGHKISECPNKKGKYCYICGKSGHIQAQCPEKSKKNNKEEVKEDKINVEEDNVLNCPICLTNSTEGKKFKVSVCGHIICKDCCDSLFKSSSSSTCPLCKKPVNKNNYRDIYI